MGYNYKNYKTAQKVFSQSYTDFRGCSQFYKSVLFETPRREKKCTLEKGKILQLRVKLKQDTQVIFCTKQLQIDKGSQK